MILRFRRVFLLWPILKVVVSCCGGGPLRSGDYMFLVASASDRRCIKKMKMSGFDVSLRELVYKYVLLWMLNARLRLIMKIGMPGIVYRSFFSHALAKMVDLQLSEIEWSSNYMAMNSSDITTSLFICLYLPHTLVAETVLAWILSSVIAQKPWISLA